MAGFSAADAAFTGFRVVWERPWAVAIWAVVQFVVSLAINLFMVATAAQTVTVGQLSQVGSGSEADLQKMAALLEQAAPTSVVMLMVALVLAAVFYAAMNRAVMRPAESRFGYLRLASDELRQLGLFVILLLLAFALYLALAVVIFVVVAILALALGAGAETGVGLMMAALLPVLICAFIFVGVRLSLASPLTFATGRIHVFASWAMTRHRFWPLFGTYLIAIALSFVVTALTLVIALLAVAILGGSLQAVGPALQSDPTTFQALLTPARLIYLAIVSVGAALSSPITLCPPAAIYQSLAAAAPGVPGRTFD